MNITKAISDKNRVRILMALRRQELCVCQLTDLLELAPSTVSKHLYILNQARLVIGRKEGRWVYYGLPKSKVPHTAQAALEWVCKSLTEHPKILEDENRLENILQTSGEVICSS